MKFKEQLEEYFSKLSKYRGRVTVIYVKDGKVLPENGELENVNVTNTGGGLQIKLFDGTSTEHITLPFLGSFSTAIKKVTDESGNILYENRLVKKSYNKEKSLRIKKRCGFDKF